ncbi:MAG: acetate--CoA ligase family protein [Bacteroidetes bacterium]|nr:acetate--CoA ligase family protein [Bacteroidota bacterium]
MLFDAAGIPRAKEIIVSDKKDIEKALSTIDFPIVMKVVGPVHKSDVGGVKLNIKDLHTALETFDKMMTIPDSTGVLIQPMLSGIELFVGAKRDNSYGHIILCGLGGIFIEVLKDVQSALAPVGKDEALDMLKSLKGYKILQGTRGQEGVNQDILVDIILRLSALLKYAPEIFEMDINPLLGTSKSIIAVDGRIRIEHK